MYLEGADFRLAKGLKCKQIKEAINYQKALFPEELMTSCVGDYVKQIQKLFPPDVSDTPVQLDVDKVSKEAFARNRQGVYAYKTGNFDLAVEHFAAVELLIPNNSAVKYNKVLAFFKLKNYKMAVETLKIANSLREGVR